MTDVKRAVVLRYHMKMDIRGALRNWDDRLMRGTITDNGRVLSNLEARAMLMTELAKGTKYLPCGDCDNWDPVHGCLGHADVSA